MNRRDAETQSKLKALFSASPRLSGEEVWRVYARRR